MGKRITRAKAQDHRPPHIPYRVPAAGDLPDARSPVCSRSLYLVFNEGYLAGPGDDPCAPT